MDELCPYPDLPVPSISKKLLDILCDSLTLMEVTGGTQISLLYSLPQPYHPEQNQHIYLKFKNLWMCFFACVWILSIEKTSSHRQFSDA